MKISRNWLENYISSDKTDDQLVDMFTQLGLECTVSSYKNNFSGIYVGKVVKCKKHPNADKLKLCEIAVGNDIKEIICGAPNIKKGLTVPVAIIGSKVGDLNIKKVKIRDIFSNGMVCSGKELGINNDHTGIMILDDKLNSGMDIIKALNLEEDSIFDFDITPNRGDCFSHLGIARELGIIEKKNIKIVDTKLEANNFKTSDLVKVKIKDKNICQRYSCQIIKNINVQNSPQWLKSKLNLIAQKSINNIIDLSNYIMFDTGQPLHVFDYDKIEGNINVRLANKGEELLTLDNINIKLSVDDIVIADDKKPIAIAGVIGGLNSSVGLSTKNILIESAVFDELKIRKTSKKYNYSKESSKRFERGIDSQNTIYSMNKFSTLLLDLSYGEISSDNIDIDNTYENKLINFDMKKCNKFLGTDISEENFKEIFRNLNLKINNNSKYIIPSYRNDLTFEVDLYEEVARVYGYDNIPSSINFSVPSKSFIEDSEILDSKIRNFLSSNGFNEHYSNSLYSKNDCELNINYKAVKLINPLSKEMEYIRNSLLPGLLRAVSFNERRGKKFIKLFEIGNISYVDNNSYSKTSQIKKLMLVWRGDKINHWKNPIKQDVFSIKGEVKLMLKMLNISNIYFKSRENILDIVVKEKTIGYIKLINKSNISNYDLSSSVYICSINLDSLNDNYINNNITFNKIYSFPSIERDISILIDKKYTNQEIQSIIIKNGGKYLKDINLFDLYEGDGVADDSKSLAYSLKFNSNSKTLTDKEVDISVSKILENLKSVYNVIQR